MNLSKKGLLALPLAALLFVSCGKNISYNDAVEFVKTNYTSTEAKTPKKAHLTFKGVGTDEEGGGKTYIKDMFDYMAPLIGITDKLPDNLEYDKDFTAQPTPPITTASLENSGIGVDVTYTLKGKSLTMKMHTMDISSLLGYSLEINSAFTTNDEGYQISSSVEQIFDGNVPGYSNPISGNFHYTITCEY